MVWAGTLRQTRAGPPEPLCRLGPRLPVGGGIAGWAGPRLGPDLGAEAPWISHEMTAFAQWLGTALGAAVFATDRLGVGRFGLSKAAHGEHPSHGSDGDEMRGRARQRNLSTQLTTEHENSRRPQPRRAAGTLRRAVGPQAKKARTSGRGTIAEPRRRVDSRDLRLRRSKGAARASASTSGQSAERSAHTHSASRAGAYSEKV